MNPLDLRNNALQLFQRRDAFGRRAAPETTSLGGEHSRDKRYMKWGAVLLIAFAGLPGSGKSSLAKIFAKKIDTEAFCEPEEAEWPSLIHERRIYGNFTGLSWFRMARVELLFKAKEESKKNGSGVVDSYYDVLIHHYLGNKNFHWLIHPSDPYFATAKQMAAADYSHLPRADAIVFLEVDFDTWQKMLLARGRRLDKEDGLDQQFGMQKEILAACEATARDQGSKLIKVKQHWGKQEEVVRKAYNEIFG